MRTSIEVTDTGLKRSPVHREDAQAFDLLMSFYMSFFYRGAGLRLLMLHCLIFFGDSDYSPIDVHDFPSPNRAYVIICAHVPRIENPGFDTGCSIPQF